MSAKIFPSNKTFSKLVLCMLAMAVTACQDRGDFISTRHFEDGDTLLTGASVRSINRQVYKRDSMTGRLQPAFITCAEPSPDVATAISKAFSAGGSLSAKGLPSGVEPKVAAAIARSQAQSVAQLGERLATIQLLRDGLYRACEAYANGAISPITYAVMVSRYDDTMVTLLSSELAAGAFGRTLAALESESAGSSKASGEFVDAREQSLESLETLNRESAEKESLEASREEIRNEEMAITRQLNEVRDERSELRNQLSDAQAAASVAPTAAESARIDALKTEMSRNESEMTKFESQLKETRAESREITSKLSESRKRVESAKEEHRAKLSAEAESRASAKAVAAGGIEPGKQAPEVAKVIHEIQRKFIENINSDAIEIACISALDNFRPKLDGKPTALTEFCSSEKFLEIQQGKLDLLNAIRARAYAVADYEIRRDKAMATLTDIRKYLDTEKALLEKYELPPK